MLGVIVDEDVIRIGERFALSFQRTLRIPDDSRTYPLPPGLGAFPVKIIEDYANRFPHEWHEKEGAFIPMYQREALWLSFRGASWKPNVVKIGVGGINAVSGQSFDTVLRAEPQDYMVVPIQPWIDGFKSGEGSIRQFVAMPLGLNYTVEAALTGAEAKGGIQVIVFESKPGKFPDRPPREPVVGPQRMPMGHPGEASIHTMGLGAGGVMKQKIYPDPWGVAVWDQDNFGVATVHIVNSHQYRAITGKEPPPTPIDAATYTAHGLPWFDLYDEEKGDIAPSERLAGAKTIRDVDREREATREGEPVVEVPQTQIKKLRPDETGRDQGRTEGSSSARGDVKKK